MSKTYWSQRIEELANSEKAVPDTAFFTSEAYRSYTETAAKDMITGVCGYLRRYSISEMEEDRRVNALAVEMLRNPEITAYTDGYNICIGTNNSLVTSLDSRELRHYAIQGFRVHEVAHILFTDFPTLKNWVGHLNQGIWWPRIPDRASEKDGVELTKRLKKPRFCKPFVSIARNIENALEDGFIEREIQEMYGGLATTELATLDEVQISESVSFGEMLKQKCSPFEAMLNQILLYAKYDITMDEGIPDEYVQTLEDCVFVIDDVKYERNPKKRLEGVNEICCILYPLVADLIKELEKKPKQNKSSGPKSSKSGSGICMPGQAQGSGNDQSQSQQGNGNSQSQPQAQNQQGSSNSQSQQGNATSDGGADSNSGAGGTENNADSDKEAREKAMELIKRTGLEDQLKKKAGKYSRGMRQRLGLADVLIKALEKIEQIAKDAAKRAGLTEGKNQNSESITHSSARSQEAKDRNNGKQNAKAAQASDKSNSSVQSSGKGGSSGTPDLSAAKRDINSIENARKKDAATEKANREKNNELNEEARHISSEIGTKVTVDRAQEVSKSNVAVYNELSNDLLVVTKNLERRLKTMIRDEENDDTVSGLPMGSRVEARLAYHRDGKIFSRKNFPRDNPRLAVGYLCDESGSMRDDAIEASIRTGIIIQDLCYRMELPCYVCGFTTSGFGLQIINYVDQDIDGKDKYRITGMQSRSGTPTGPAMKYMAQKLKKETAEKRLLIVSTDGCSASGRENIQKTIKELSRYGILVVGAGIGSARAQVENEFGKNFIDIGNLEAMPQILCNIVKRNLA